MANNFNAMQRENEHLRADIEALRETLAGVRSMHADALEENQRLAKLRDAAVAWVKAVRACDGESVEDKTSEELLASWRAESNAGCALWREAVALAEAGEG